MAKITKIVDFAAAHSIQGAGKCANKHGHNWEATIEVSTVAGEITDQRGFIADVADLKKTAFKYDHDDLDKYFEFASTENVAYKIAHDALEVVEKNNPDLQVFVNVHLVETKNNSAYAVATNVEFGQLNKSYFDPKENKKKYEILNPETGTRTTTSLRFVGLEGAAQDAKSEFIEQPAGNEGAKVVQMRKPELDSEESSEKDSYILFGGQYLRNDKEQ